MRSSSSSTRSSCSRSDSRLGRPRAALALIVLTLAGAAFSGCGEPEEGDTGTGVDIASAPAGDLRIAVEGNIDTLDPLLADDRAERLASRQIHEPLVSTQTGPFGNTRRRPGLAFSVKGSAGDTIWTARLRSGVRFQDGELLDAEAVLANVDRWLAVAPGPELLPDLVAADFPQPGLVRFILDRPDPGFARRLSDARLGLIAPDEIPTIGSAPVKLGSTGTGPFELRERDGGTTLLARNLSWWGADLGLGPGVEQIVLLEIEGGAQRADELIDGSVDIADALDGIAVARVKRDLLLTIVGGARQTLGMSRAVRGVESADADQALADAWLTTLR